MGLVERNVLQDKTKVILNELNQNYRKNYRTTFIKQVKQVLEMPKPQGIAKSIKRDIENQWAETCVERYFKLQNEFHNIVFCDGFLIGFCFLSQNLFIRKISFVENLQNYWKWDIGILRNFLGKTLTGIVHSSFYQDTVMLLFK